MDHWLTVRAGIVQSLRFKRRQKMGTGMGEGVDLVQPPIYLFSKYILNGYHMPGIVQNFEIQ